VVAMSDGQPRRFASVLLAVGWVATIALIVLAARRSTRLRAALARRSTMWRLASVEVARNVGVIFLLLHSQGDLPGLFAYPAAWGDIAIGTTAFAVTAIVAWRYDRLLEQGTLWRRVFIAWNVLGIADMVMAISLGLIQFPGALQLVDSNPPTTLFGELPLLLFPTFLVPFAAALHFVMLDAIRRPEIRATSAMRCPSVPSARSARPPGRRIHASG
jgi:hypothetical protein